MNIELENAITLAERVNTTSMAQVGRDIGITTDAVRQMMLNDRQIYLMKTNGVWQYSEYRPWRRGKKQ